MPLGSAWRGFSRGCPLPAPSPLGEVTSDYIGRCPVTAALVHKIAPWGDTGRLTPRVNWGRWIVDCPNCSSALMIDPEWGWTVPRSKVVRPRDFFECWHCGTRCDVEWPPDELVFGAERLLMMRPDPKTRNFDPQTETLTNLMWENGAHGIFDQLDQLDLHGVSDHNVLTVDDSHIRADRLPLTGYWPQHDHLREITAG